MKIGAIISVPERHAKAKGKITIQPGLPGRWSIWSKAGECASGYFLVPADAVARETGIKFAVVRITEPQGQVDADIALKRTEPTSAMPKARATR